MDDPIGRLRITGITIEVRSQSLGYPTNRPVARLIGRMASRGILRGDFNTVYPTIWNVYWANPWDVHGVLHDPYHVPPGFRGVTPYPWYIPWDSLRHGLPIHRPKGCSARGSLPRSTTSHGTTYCPNNIPPSQPWDEMSPGAHSMGHPMGYPVAYLMGHRIGHPTWYDEWNDLRDPWHFLWDATKDDPWYVSCNISWVVQ